MDLVDGALSDCDKGAHRVIIYPHYRKKHKVYCQSQAAIAYRTLVQEDAR